jgi:hypothetical protein
LRFRSARFPEWVDVEPLAGTTFRVSAPPPLLESFNGLLLAPHVDALFDSGWISFALDGGVVLSPLLTASARSSLGVRADWRVVGLAA